jgi:hypothetical protein
MKVSPLKLVFLITLSLLFPLQNGFGQCLACTKINTAIESYEEVEQEIEEWVVVGFAAFTNDDGEIVEEAIMELQVLIRLVLQITYFIEEQSEEHTCELPAEELPEYIPPPPPIEHETNPWDPYSDIA